ncbi:tetratricopeptide repeat protein [Flammeovirgaceae bacterium SG7u.111]|nr:tetratricopeptide repeat protein [Flammeovirgaceae bacterium SG7u.132]WPO36774.1 tetratricopeptide repeat protein [Flammeovirgaceae bacterium SG7u.111]
MSRRDLIASWKKRAKVFYAFVFFCCAFSGATLAQERIESFSDMLNYYDGDSAGIEDLLEEAYSFLAVGKTSEALQIAERSWALANHTGYLRGKAKSLILMGEIDEAEDQPGAALKNYIGALDIFSQAEDTMGLAEANMMLGNLYESLDAWGRASEYYANAFTAFDNLKERQWQIMSLEKVGELSKKAKLYDYATLHYEHLLDLYYLEDDQYSVAKTLGNLVSVNKLRERYQVALNYNLDLLEQLRNLGDSAGVAVAYNNIGFLNTNLGDYPNAVLYFQKAFKLDDELYSDEWKNATTLINMGISFQNMGMYNDAIPRLEAALLIYSTLGDKDKAVEVKNMLAKILVLKDDMYEAEVYAEEAVVEAKEAKDRKVLMNSYLTYSEVLQAKGKYEKALESYKSYLNFKDSLTLAEKLAQDSKDKTLLALEKQDREIKLQLADDARKDMAIRQYQLEMDKQMQQVELMQSEQAIRDYEIREEQLEKDKSLQRLALEKEKLNAQYQAEAIKALEADKLRKELEIKERETANRARLQQIEMLEQGKKNAERERNRARWILGLFIVISVLVIVGLIFTFFVNKKLKRQKREIEKINQEISLKNEEVMAQSEKLKIANDEIQLSHAELEQKTEEVITQSERLKQANSEIAQQRDEIIRSYETLENTHFQLKTTQSQLVDSEKMASLGQLTAGIAHEINNPINFVSGNVLPLRRDLDDIKQFIEKAKRLDASNNISEELKGLREFSQEIDLEYVLQEIDSLVNGIEEGAVRTKEIVLGLRNFSRLDENDFKTTDVHIGLDSTLTLLQSKFKGKVEVHKNYGDLQPIECLPGQLNQAFMNILGNASDAIDKKGKICISTVQHAERVEISIKDNGNGMPEHVRRKIFEPFFTTKDVGKGTGLGLSITYGIIERHNGAVKVSSEEGKGTEFLITLPVSQPSEVSKA